jgi:hypothetical protein
VRERDGLGTALGETETVRVVAAIRRLIDFRIPNGLEPAL